VRITWAIEGHGVGSAEADDVDGAARALANAVRTAYEKHGPSAQAHVLTTLVAPLRFQLVTEGRTAVERGDEWATSLGGLLVTLYPE
jgi:hypothetical protein